MSLNTGKKIKRYRWTVLPFTNEAIERMHKSTDERSLSGKATNKALYEAKDEKHHIQDQDNNC